MKNKRGLWKPITLFAVFLVLVGGAFAVYRLKPELLPGFTGTSETPALSPSESLTQSGDILQTDELAEVNALMPATSALGLLELSPTKATDDGVAIDSKFIIRPMGALTREALTQTLSNTEGVAFHINEIQANEYELAFDNPLDYDRVYRLVYAPPGMQPMSFAFQTQRNAEAPASDGASADLTDTEDTNDAFTPDGNVYETFLPGEAIAIGLIMNPEYMDIELDVDIYALETPDTYIHFYERSRNNAPSADQASLIKTIRIKPETFTGTNDRLRYLIIRESLPEGYFVLRARYGDIACNKLVQVSRLSVYSVAIGGEVCFWVNDSQNGQPVADARINLGGRQGVTDAQGKLILKVPPVSEAVAKISTLMTPDYIYISQIPNTRALTAGEKYFHYMVTDQEKYLPDDTIQVFGVVQPTYAQNAFGSNDKIFIQAGDNDRRPLSLNDNGCFTASIFVKDLANDLTLRVYVNDDLLTEKEIQLQEVTYDGVYVRTTADRRAYFSGEEAIIRVEVSSADKTPVHGVELTHSFTDPIFVTDENGTDTRSVVLRPISVDEPTDWRPYSIPLILGMESEAVIVENPQPMILPGDIMAEHRVVNPNTIELQVSHVNRDALENALISGSLDPNDPDTFRGAPADIDYQFEIFQRSHERERTGERYDTMAHTAVAEYRYNPQTKPYQIVTGRTKDGRANIGNLPVSADPLVDYYGVLSFRDTRGVMVRENIYYSGDWMSAVSTSPEYIFELMRPGQQESLSALKINETAHLKVKNTGQSSGDLSGGRMLYVVAQNEILEAATGEEPFVFREAYAAGIEVFGAYFDGTQIFPIRYPLMVKQDTTDRELNVRVTLDKNTYVPGDAANITIQTTDAAGRPCKATVNLHAENEQTNRVRINLLNQSTRIFYDSAAIRDLNYNVYASNQRYFFQERGYYKDSPGFTPIPFSPEDSLSTLFKTIETDAGGTASVTFTLPKTISRSLITATAFSQNLRTGVGQYVMNVEKAFAVDLIMPNEYVYGDDTVFWVKPGGNANPPQSQIEYTLNIFSNVQDMDIPQNKRYEYNDRFVRADMAFVNLGSLPEGEYTARVSAHLIDLPVQNEAEKKFKVIGSSIQLPLQKKEILSTQKSQLDVYGVISSPVEITLSNADASYFFDLLDDCMNTDSDRPDDKAAVAFGSDFLAEQGGKALSGLKDTINWTAGTRENSDMSDPIFWARFAAAFPELIHAGAIPYYTEQVFQMYDENGSPTASGTDASGTDENFEMNRAAGYLFEAAAGGNVLREIRRQIETAKSASSAGYEHQMRLLLYAAALCVSGDDAGAAQCMAELPTYDEPNAAPETKRQHREMIDALTLFVQSTTDPAAAWQTISTKPKPIYISDVCERIHFLRTIKPASNLSCEVSYTLENQPTTKQLSGFKAIRFSLSKEEFSNLQLKPISGRTTVRLRYNGRPADLTVAQNLIGLERKIEPAPESKIAEDSILSFDVQMPPDAPTGFYTIRDRVPGHMRFAGSESAGDIFIRQTAPQVADITFYYDGKSIPEWLRYRVFRVGDGEAALEKAYISQNFEPDQIWGASS